MKRILVIAIILPILLLLGCSAGDPVTDDVYIQGDLYVWDGTAWVTVNTLGGGDVTAAANLGDNKVIRGDGGAKGVQDSLVTISDLGTVTAPVFVGNNGLFGGLLQADILAGDIEGYCVDVVQASDLDIVLNDTLALTFSFEPSIIVIDYSVRCRHDTTFESGHSTGHSIVTRTAVNTITHNTNMTALVSDWGEIGSVGVQNDVADVIVAYGGYDGTDQAIIFGSGTWVSATHTLTITFNTVSNTQTAFNYVEMVATAYR